MTQVLYFSTPTCGPCKMFKPVVQQVAAELGINVAYVDATVDQNRTQQFNISVVPTIVIENNGNTVYRNSGVMSKPQLIHVLSQFR